jgi:hypothetical protein
MTGSGKIKKRALLHFSIALKRQCHETTDV